MDWIRRNWPDLLIGFALLAVISGIVATLLTGGSFFPLGGNGADTPRPAAQTQDANPRPNQPVAQPNQPLQQPDGASTEPLAELPLLTQNPPDSGTPADNLLADGPVDPFADLEDPQDLPTVVALRPGSSGNAEAPATQAPAPAGDAPAPADSQPAAQPQSTPQATSQSGTSDQQVTSGESPSTQVPYTVGVGAFRDAANAERQANVFRQAGYPVVVASQDDLTVVLLGPYATRTEADRVLGEVTSGGFGIAPIVYTYQGEENGQQTSTASQPAASAEPAPPTASQPSQPAAPAGNVAAGQTPAAASTATEAGRYLQVGAFSSEDNAGAQADVLEGLGYTVIQQQDGNLIRVLVGPYPAGQLDDARNRLAAQGIDSVPR